MPVVISGIKADSPRVTSVMYTRAHLAAAVSTLRQASGYLPSCRVSPPFGRYSLRHIHK